MLNPPDLISIIIPVYNGARYLGEAIESVLAQAHRPLELLVIDDGSSDGSTDLAAAYGPPVYVERQAHSGAAAARNRGITLAHGNLLAFLDADDRLATQKLELQLAALAIDPALEAVFGHVEHFYSPDLPAAERALLQLPPPQAAYLAWTMLIRRVAFMRVGFFDPRWRVGETIDWFARARELQLRTLMLPAVVVHRRLHKHNQGRTMRNLRSDYLHILKASLDRRRASAAKRG